MALSVVQTQIFGANDGAAVHVSSPQTYTTGNLLVLGWRNGGSNHISATGVADLAGNTWIPLTLSQNGAVSCVFYYAKNITGMANDTITVVTDSTGGSGSNFGHIWEIAGADTSSPADVDVGVTGTSVSSLTTPTFSTVVPAEILLALGVTNVTANTYTPPSGFTDDGTDANGTSNGSHQIVSSIQSGVTLTESWGTSASLGLLRIASFKSAIQPAAGVPNSLMLLGCGT